jgi:hypothetical protein
MLFMATPPSVVYVKRGALDPIADDHSARLMLNGIGLRKVLAIGEAKFEAGQDDFARRRRRVFAKQMQRLIDYDWGVIAHIAEGAEHALSDRMNLVGATHLRVVAALFRESLKACAIDWLQVGGDGLGGCSGHV